MSASANANASASSSRSTPDARPEIPWAFHDCSTETLIVLISHMLNLLIQHNDQVILTPDSLTRFHSKSAPDIKVLDYLTRIVKYTNMEVFEFIAITLCLPQSNFNQQKIPLLSLLAYIDVTCTNLPTFTLSSLTVHRFLIAGVCAGSKAQCDVFCTNSHYAKVGGIQIKELNALEMEFLKVTRWDLCCKAELLQRYYTSLIKSHGGFTQAAEPADNPFAKLPQSTAGPSTETAMQPVPDVDHPPTSETVEDNAGSSISSRNDGNADIASPSRELDTRHSDDAGTRVRPKSGRASRQNPHIDEDTHTEPGSGKMGMDVDEDGPPSPNDQMSSPASSSVPSSSRSSLRARNVSAAQLAPPTATAASPRVDMTTASGRVVMDIDAEENTERATAIDSGNAIEDSSRLTQQPTAGGKLFKSLVGGIFKRRNSAHHSDPPPPPHPQQPPPQPTHPTRNGGTTRLVPPHQSPGRRVKSPLMTTMPQGDPPPMAAPVTPRVRSREETNGF